jgi:RNA polymerase sigma factor (sigma-70 family)
MAGTTTNPTAPGHDADRPLLAAMEREEGRLRGFIRRRVASSSDVEDILQDVFCELVEAYRLMEPIGHVGGWLVRVARNRIVDLWRKRRWEGDLPEAAGAEEPRERFEDLLPSPDAGPEAAFARRVLVQELADAVDELPANQRFVFVAHEIEGRGFREIAAETGTSVNTLLSRKHYAVLKLRRRLQTIYTEHLGQTRD